MSRQWRMLPEWGPHKRTWMAWPLSRWVLANDPEGAWQAWANTANAVSAFEPVVMVANTGQGEQARKYLDASIEIVEHPIGESWMRDSGPTFVVDEAGALGGIDWTFNGWGGRTFPECRMDALLAREVISRAGAERIASRLINEGGAIHVDGEGTLLVTETVQLNENRNPNWTRDEVETELKNCLGVSKIIWLPRGLAADLDETGTDGHIDTIACFAKPGVVLVHGQPDPDHPDFEMARENEAILCAETDAKGRPLEVIRIDAPAPKTDAEGAPLSCTYINFSFVNGGVIMCAFDDARDQAVADLFASLWPERKIVPVAAKRIFEGGGGVHCITQHEPLAGGA